MVSQKIDSGLTCPLILVQDPILQEWYTYPESVTYTDKLGIQKESVIMVTSTPDLDHILDVVLVLGLGKTTGKTYRNEQIWHPPFIFLPSLAILFPASLDVSNDTMDYHA